MIIGYSFWGFLGHGITDTPDGGRSHRRPWIDALVNAGHHVVFLQANRDLAEAGDDLGKRYAFDAGLPEIEVLFLEWRWPIKGRNTSPCGSAGHTCDLHRQRELLEHYTLGNGIRTIIWDKDRQLPPDDPLRRHAAVIVCEAALHPTPGAHRLLFPLDDALLEKADPAALAALPRPVSLIYIGNQYDRDKAFDAYVAPAAGRFRHLVAGKWTDTRRWPEVIFAGRVSFERVRALYRGSLATVLLLPERYAAAGQVTQRIFEAVLSGCLPLAPAEIRDVERFVPPELVVRDGAEVIGAIQRLNASAGTGEHADLIAACVERLSVFRLSRQLAQLQSLLEVTGRRP